MMKASKISAILLFIAAILSFGSVFLRYEQDGLMSTSFYIGVGCLIVAVICFILAKRSSLHDEQGDGNG